MFGNLLLVLWIITHGGLVQLTSKPMPGGDYRVGYAYAWIACVGGFVVSTGLLAWNMGLNHCFDWAPTLFLRYHNWLVFFGWILFVAASVWSLDYRTKWIEGEFPQFMRWLLWSKVFVWLPLLMLIPVMYLLNADRPAGFAPSWVKIPMQTGFFVSILIGLGLFYGFAKASVQQRIALNQSAKKRDGSGEKKSWSFEKSMDEIEAYQGKKIRGLLLYTHREKEEEIRNAAVAKIRSIDHWENELLQILDHGEIDDVYWVFAFLDGNKIDHPEKFIQPVKISLGSLTSRLQASLKDPNSLQMGYINIEALCRVLDTQFKASAAEFRPGILSMQKVLETTPPERNNKQNKAWFDSTLIASRLAVNKWLESNN